MQQFKVGDWVVGKHNKNPIHIKDIGTTPTNSSVTINGTFSVDQFTLWQPKEGEWCWFWNGEGINSIDPFIARFNKCSRLNAFDYCEPFIGELPSFLKEQQ